MNIQNIKLKTTYSKSYEKNSLNTSTPQSFSGGAEQITKQATKPKTTLVKYLSGLFTKTKKQNTPTEIPTINTILKSKSTDSTIAVSNRNIEIGKSGKLTAKQISTLKDLIETKGLEFHHFEKPSSNGTAGYNRASASVNGEITTIAQKTLHSPIDKVAKDAVANYNAMKELTPEQSKKMGVLLENNYRIQAKGSDYPFKQSFIIYNPYNPSEEVCTDNLTSAMERATNTFNPLIK